MQSRLSIYLVFLATLVAGILFTRPTFAQAVYVNPSAPAACPTTGNGIWCSGSTLYQTLNYSAGGGANNYAGFGLTAYPVAPLDVAGEIRTNGGTLACSSTTTGAIRYNSSTNGMEYCGGAIPAWTALGGGGMTLISTQTASSSASLPFTSLPTTYNTLFMDCNGIIPATNATNFEVQVGEGATPTWKATNQYYGSFWYTQYSGTTSGVNTQNSTAALVVAPSAGTTSGYSVSVKLWISNIASTTLIKQITFQTSFGNSSSLNESTSGGGGYYGDLGALTALRVLFSSGNITSGQCSLYGMNS